MRKLETVHAEIEKLGLPEASIVPLDLERALAADYEAVAAAVEKRYGRLDGLLHNAALLGALTPIEQYDVPMFLRVMHVNVTAEFVLTRQLLPLLRAAKDAAVLFTSSGVGNRGRAYWGAYSISKFAVEGLAQVLAQELEGTSRVRVNIIDPARCAPPCAAPPILPKRPNRCPRPNPSPRPGWRCSAPRAAALRASVSRHSKQGFDVAFVELTELTAHQALVQFGGTDGHAQHTADQCTLPLEQLANVLAAGAARHHGVPAVGALELRVAGGKTFNLHARRPVEFAALHSGELVGP